MSACATKIAHAFATSSTWLFLLWPAGAVLSTAAFAGEPLNFGIGDQTPPADADRPHLVPIREPVQAALADAEELCGVIERPRRAGGPRGRIARVGVHGCAFVGGCANGSHRDRPSRDGPRCSGGSCRQIGEGLMWLPLSIHPIIGPTGIGFCGQRRRAHAADRTPKHRFRF